MKQLPRTTRGEAHGVEQETGLDCELLADLHNGFETTSFEEYPTARGIPAQNLRIGDFEPGEAGKALAIVQNWLFFGLLESVLRMQIDTERFIERGAGGGDKAFLTTQALPEYIETWRKDVQKLDGATKNEWREEIRAIFRFAAYFYAGFVSTASKRFPTHAGDYLNPLAVLHETMQLARSDVFDEIEEGEPLVANFSAAKVRLLQSKGWCPCTIQDIAIAFNSPSVFSFAVSMQDHEAMPKGGHEACNGNSCKRMVIDPSTYQPRHLDDNCECERLTPDLWLLYAIIKMNGIVLIQLTETGEIDTIPYKQGGETPFVAISHVWSDGRGSWSEQGLPKCQLHALFKAASAAYRQTFQVDTPHIAIWMDSLCIPRSTEFRAQAIGLISETFWAAEMVLVVDNGISKIKLSDSLQEQLFLIFISGWMQRLWTLVEGLRAKMRLIFWVMDGFLDSRKFVDDEAIALKGKDVVSTELLGCFAQLLITSITPGKLSNLLVHMARRRTSWAEDEIVAIADFFGLETSAYIPLSREERMQKFLIEHNETRIESSIIFFGSLKLQVPGFTWAPLTFLRIQDMIPNIFFLKGDSEEMGVITNDGLVSKYHYFGLQQRWVVPSRSIRTSNGDPILLRDQNSSDMFKAIPARLWDENPEAQPTDFIPDCVLLSRHVEPQEEFLGVAAKQLDIIYGEDGIDALVVTRLFDVHIFNDPSGIDDSLPAYSVKSGDLIFNVR